MDRGLYTEGAALSVRTRIALALDGRERRHGPNLASGRKAGQTENSGKPTMTERTHSTIVVMKSPLTNSNVIVIYRASLGSSLHERAETVRRNIRQLDRFTSRALSDLRGPQPSDESAFTTRRQTDSRWTAGSVIPTFAVERTTLDARDEATTVTA